MELQANESILWLMLGLALLLLWMTIIMLRSENERTTLEQSQKRLRIIDAFSQAYVAIMLVQLKEKTVEVIKTAKGSIHDYKAAMTVEEQKKQIRRFVAEPYRENVLKFCELSTVEQRLQEHPTLSYTWQTAAGGWMETLLVPQRYDDKGRLMAVLVANRDVTEEKKRELATQHQAEAAAEEARRANAAKTDFLRRMSHDVRTPINGIRGMVEISRHYVGDEAKQEECREKIMAASGFLLDLVNNVLDMNKLESGEIQLESVSFDLASLVQETINVVEVQAAEHGITLRHDPIRESIEHSRLIGSPVHLRQVLQNISSNAIKYTPTGDTVHLNVRELNMEDGMAWFEFTCADNGIGMSESFQQHVFEPFAQEDANARTAYSGTGLGLSITKELVEQMGGSIRFESTQGMGTLFTIRLPFRVDTEAARPQKQDAVQADIHGMHILLVEDNELNMEIAQFLLENAGAVVSKAWDGQQAVDAFAASRPGTYDVILMDVMMPVMDGLEAARTIRAMGRPDAASVPIFAMTANAFYDDVQRSRDAGMDEHLTKPLDAQALFAAIARYRR